MEEKSFDFVEYLYDNSVFGGFFYSFLVEFYELYFLREEYLSGVCILGRILMSFLVDYEEFCCL